MECDRCGENYSTRRTGKAIASKSAFEVASPAPSASLTTDGAERERLPNCLNLWLETTNDAAVPLRKPIFSPKFGYNGTSNSSTPASENNDSATNSPSQELYRNREQLTLPDTGGTDSYSRVKSASSSSQYSLDSRTKLISLIAPCQHGPVVVNENHSPAAGDTENNTPTYIKPSAPPLASNITVPRASASAAGGRGGAMTAATKKIAKTVSWKRDLLGGVEERNFTMRRVHEKAFEQAHVSTVCTTRAKEGEAFKFQVPQKMLAAKAPLRNDKPAIMPPGVCLSFMIVTKSIKANSQNPDSVHFSLKIMQFHLDGTKRGVSICSSRA